MESSQVTPERIDETIGPLGEGVKNLAMNEALNQPDRGLASQAGSFRGPGSWSP